MPIFTGRIAVTLDIANQFAVCFGSRIKTERSFYLIILQVAIDGLGAADHLHAIVLGSIILGQHTSIGIGVIATDNDNGLDVELANHFESLFKLLLLLQFGTSGTDHVKTACVTVFVNDVGSKLFVVVVNKSARPHEETIKAIVRIQALDGIEKTANHIVAAGSLAAPQNHSDIHLAGVGLVTGNKLHQRHSISVGEQLLDFFLIANALRRFTFFHLDGTLKTFWQLGTIFCPFTLQATFFHNLFINVVS